MISKEVYYDMPSGNFIRIKTGKIIPKDAITISVAGKNYRRSALIRKYFIEQIMRPKDDCHS